MDIKQREDKARRRLRKEGYLVSKDRSHAITANHLGGYRVYDAHTNCVVRGSNYDCELDDLETFADELEADDGTGK